MKNHQLLKAAAACRAMRAASAVRTGLRWSACVSIALLPIIWAQYARGFSIPPREPPATTSSNTSESMSDLGESPQLSSAAPANAAVKENSELDTIAPEAAADSFAAMPAPAITRGVSVEQQQSTGAAGVGETDSQRSSTEAEADPKKLPAEQGASSVTVLVEEPGVAAAMPGASEDRLSAQAAPTAAQEIVEVDAAHELAKLAPTAPALEGQKSQHTRRKLRLRLALAESVTKTRGLGDAQIIADATNAPLARPVPAPSENQHVGQSQGGRGIAQVADLGRSSRLASAATDVFAAGHHVVAVACDATAYVDASYFNRDPFGNSRSPKCP